MLSLPNLLTLSRILAVPPFELPLPRLTHLRGERSL